MITEDLTEYSSHYQVIITEIANECDNCCNSNKKRDNPLNFKEQVFIILLHCHFRLNDGTKDVDEKETEYEDSIHGHTHDLSNCSC